MVRVCAARGWDYSINVANDQWRRPVLDQIEGLTDDAWTDIGLGDESVLATHRPRDWDVEQRYVVVRRCAEGGQDLLIPHRTVIPVSRSDPPIEELVLRHRGRQGQENAFKEPLRDMDLHHPPCRGCRANRAFHALGRIAQVPLHTAQFTALPKRAHRHRIRSVIRCVMRTAAHRVRLRFAKTNFRLDWPYGAMISLEGRRGLCSLLFRTPPTPPKATAIPSQTPLTAQKRPMRTVTALSWD